jgi:hypothetical protein
MVIGVTVLDGTGGGVSMNRRFTVRITPITEGGPQGKEMKSGLTEYRSRSGSVD